MHLSIPIIPTLETGRIFEDENYLYLNFPNSPKFGNLQMRHHNINERHLSMNELIMEIYVLHSLTIKEHAHIETYSYQRSQSRLLFMIENIVYWIRKNIDEMIGLNFYAYYLDKHNAEPDKLEISSIGKLVNSKTHALYSKFSEYIDKLNRINDVSNTFKHSFITSETNHLIGRNEPTVNCLELSWNNTENEPKFHTYYLRDIISDYVEFFVFSRNTLKTFNFFKNLNEGLRKQKE